MTTLSLVSQSVTDRHAIGLKRNTRALVLIPIALETTSPTAEQSLVAHICVFMQNFAEQTFVTEPGDHHD